jgi:hypothetical protein
MVFIRKQHIQIENNNPGSTGPQAQQLSSWPLRYYLTYKNIWDNLLTPFSLHMTTQVCRFRERKNIIQFETFAVGGGGGCRFIGRNFVSEPLS